MIKGIFTSAAGMLPRMLQQEVIANNLANAATVGYKKDRLFLKTMMDASLVLQKDTNQNPLMLNAEKISTVLSQGGLRATGNPLDFALSGSGFFVVNTPSGTMYSRDGRFSLTAEGDLVTVSGFPVLGEGGPINLPKGDITITPTGVIQVNGLEVDMLKVVNFEEPNSLYKQGDNLFAARDDATERQAFGTTVSQGFVENSNVEAIKEMVDMITLHRMYETSARALMAQDETLDKAVNQVGSVR
jgi:flagellar basal-body rod protein FlgF